IFHPLPVCHSQISPFFSPAIIFVRSAPGPLRAKKFVAAKPPSGSGTTSLSPIGSGAHRASDPCQRWRFNSRVHFENLYRFSIAMMDRIERVGPVPACAKSESVCPEACFFRCVWCAGAGIVCFCVELFLRSWTRIRHRGGEIAGVDQTDSAFSSKVGCNDPFRSGQHNEIFGCFLTAHELNVPGRVAWRRRLLKKQTEQYCEPH